MKKKLSLKIFIIFILMVLAIFVYNTIVYSSSFAFSVNATKTKLKPGEETTVTMKISDISDTNDLGINAVESTLEYDKDILEVITTNDMTGKNNWTITYNEQEGNFLVHNLISGVKQDQDIGEIKFKVKDNVERKTKTVIKFKNVKSNDGDNLINENDKQIELIIDWDDEAKQNTIQIETIEQKEQVATGKIPQTGETLLGTIGIATVSIAIAIFSYIRYKNIDIK